MPRSSTIAIRVSPTASSRFLNAEKEFTVGENVPYTVSDATDFTIPVHAERRGLHHVLIEIRRDLLADESGQSGWALRLARLLPLGYRDL